MVTFNRRELLAGVVGAGAAVGAAGLGVPGLATLAGSSPAVAAALGSPKVADAATASPGPLVLCTLFGGNDGLNTVVPYETGQYIEWRQQLAIPAHQVHPIGSFDGVALGLHPALTSLHSLFMAGRVAVICGVEYPAPSFSHFQSTSIWQTADPSGDKATGWLGRWLDIMGTDPMRAISVGPTLPQTLVGATQQASSLDDSTSGAAQLPVQSTNTDFIAAYQAMMAPSTGQGPLEQLVGTAGADLLTVGRDAAAALDAETPPRDPAGRHTGDLGVQLGVVAECIRYGLPTEVYNVSFGSFDTHSDQGPTHAFLLSQVDAAINAFMSDFRAPAVGKNPVVVIYSEFGRTPKVNASDGTDHSSPSVVLVVGPGVKGGFYGKVPSFTNLDAYGNQLFTTDFRSIYATVLEQVLDIEAARILGTSFPTLGFL